jgi:DNA (cytosine-5)-methyltransferase 1
MLRSGHPTFLSLFSGCGGLDLGFKQAGFVGLLSVDLDDAALAVHKANLDCPVQRLDLAQDLPGLPEASTVDVLLAGSPCQGFSTVGRRRIDDPRNSLLLVTSRVAKRHRPKVVVAENVLGAISGDHRSYWTQLHGRLRALGYNTHDLKVNSHHFGVAQTRQRIFLIGWKNGAIPSFVMEERDRKVLADVLHGLEDAPNHTPLTLDPDSNDFKIAARIGQGQKLTNSRAGETAVHTWHIPEVFGRTTANERSVLSRVLRLRRQSRRREFGDADPISTRVLIAEFGEPVIAKLLEKKYLRKLGKYHDLTNTFNGKYRRLRLDAPSRTVDTKFGEPRLFLHPTEHRGFTVREAARIQGFVDEFVFDGSVAQQFRMIGNAVPPPLARSVAEYVRSLL